MQKLQLFKVCRFTFWQPCWWAKNAHQPIFPYYIIEKSPTSLAHNSVLIGPNNFESGTETRCMVLQAVSKFGAN